jgi:hypothetical protein
MDFNHKFFYALKKLKLLNNSNILQEFKTEYLIINLKKTSKSDFYNKSIKLFNDNNNNLQENRN